MTNVTVQKELRLENQQPSSVNKGEGSQIIPRKGSSESEKPDVYNKPVYSFHKTSDSDISCIYRIYNTVNNKSYIGKTKSLQKRLRKHRKNIANIRNNKITSSYHGTMKPLVEDLDKHGNQSLRVEILSFDLSKEEYFIKKYGSVENGYNSVHNTDNNFLKSSVYYKDVVKYREKTYKPVLAFDLKGNLIAEYKSVSHAAKDINDQSTNVSGAAKGEQTKYLKGRVFVYKNNYNPSKDYTYKRSKVIVTPESTANRRKGNGTQIVINNIHFYSYNETKGRFKYSPDQIRVAMQKKRPLEGLEMSYYEDMIEADRKLLERPVRQT